MTWNRDPEASAELEAAFALETALELEAASEVSDEECAGNANSAMKSKQSFAVIEVSNEM